MSSKPSFPALKSFVPFVLSGIALIVVLTLLLRDVVRESILKPLSYAWNLIGLLIDGTPQALFWGVFILIAIFISLRALLVSKPQALPAATVHEEATGASQDRVYHWIIQVQSALHGNIYFRDRVTRSLERVVMGVIAYQERMTNKEVTEALSRHELELPVEVNALFDDTLEEGAESGLQRGGLFGRVQGWFSRTADSFNQRWLKRVPVSRYHRLDEIVEYLETQLEIKHGS